MHFYENHSASLSGHKATSEDKIVQNYSRQTNVYELHCQTISRKCVLDRHASVKTCVLNGSVSQNLTRYNAYCTRPPNISEFSDFCQDQCRNVKS